MSDLRKMVGDPETAALVLGSTRARPRSRKFRDGTCSAFMAKVQRGDEKQRERRGEEGKRRRHGLPRSQVRSGRLTDDGGGRKSRRSAADGEEEVRGGVATELLSTVSLHGDDEGGEAEISCDHGLA